MVQEKIVVGAGGKFPLQGMLTLPDDCTVPVPAVVFVHGSGSSNMDEKVGKLTPFKDLAEGLAKHGIASVRYDKRTYSYGLKMARSKTPITVKEESIEDAVLAAELLRADERVDSENIFIIGHSMGAMLAPRIDGSGGNFKGLILMAGTPRTLEEVMIGQNEAVLAESKGLVRWIMKKQVAKFTKLFDGLYEMSDEAAKKKKVGNGATLYYFKEMGEHPAADYLNKLEKPMLIMQGSEDFQAKADPDFTGYQSLLEGRDHVTFKLYEGLNHAFVPAIYRDIKQAKKEYNVERHIGEDVIGDIAAWIKSVVS